MTELIDTTEMYLRTIFELEEEGIPPLRARIAERLGHSGPTVSQTVARMERDGLLYLADGRRLVLTESGGELATRVMRKHRLAERLLVDVIGLPWHEAHEEACRWEHVMSEAVEQRVLVIAPGAEESPYGNPVPGLAELGHEPAPPFLDGVVSLPSLLAGTGDAWCPMRVVRLGESVQTDAEQLLLLQRAGVLPGADVEARGHGERVEVRGGAGTVDLPGASAAHIFIRAL